MTYSSTLFAHYLDLAATPIGEGSVAGEDVRFSSEFESLEAELGKAQSMHGTTQVDWLIIRETSEALLRNQSKDLRVCAWLTWALYQRESFQGLLAGIGLLQHLCEHQWAQIHPRKSRTRVAAIDWLLPRLEQVLGDDVPIKEQLALFQRMVALLEALDRVLTGHLGDDAPLLLPLVRRLKAMVQRALENTPEPSMVSAAVAHVKHAATQLFAPEALIDNERDAHKALRAQQENARALCVWWLKHKATDLRALHLNRTLLWLPIDVLPERNADNMTALRGLPGDKLKTYLEYFEQRRFADLLVELEACVAKSPFWFDGQRLVWECLQGLDAELAMREVEIHFALFIQRLPGIVELRYHDGVPFADSATRAWISAHVMPHLQSTLAPRVAPSSTTQPAWELALDEAIALLRQEGLKAAVQRLKLGLRAAQGARAQFFWRLSLAQLCVEAKKYELAMSQLDTLDSQLQQCGVHTWEPDLALHVLHLLHSCCELLPQGHAVRERKQELFRRLCHLDLEVVIQ